MIDWLLSATFITAARYDKTAMSVTYEVRLSGFNKKFAHTMTEKIELLSYLKQNNVLIACVTNSIRETATEMLNTTGQLQFFDLLVSNEDVARNKPYPDCYIHAMEKLKINPNEIVCVEDSDKGVEAVLSSGAKYLWRVKNSTEVVLENFRRFVYENFNSDGG